MSSINNEIDSQNKALANANQANELRFITAMINPTFIQNSINYIRNHLRTQTADKSNLYVTKFSRLLRHILNVSDKSYITLSEELDIINLYLSHESMKLPIPVAYSVEIKDDIIESATFIPPLILQHIISAVVENKVFTFEIKITMPNEHLQFQLIAPIETIHISDDAIKQIQHHINLAQQVFGHNHLCFIKCTKNIVIADIPTTTKINSL